MRRIIGIIRGDPNWGKLGKLLQKGAAIIDLRSEVAYRKWHIQGAIHIPFRDLGIRIGEIKKLDRPVITYCRDGKFSRLGARILRRFGVKAYNGGAGSQLVKKLKLR